MARPVAPAAKASLKEMGPKMKRHSKASPNQEADKAQAVTHTK